MTAPPILVYYPDALARDFADLVRPPRRAMPVRVASTPEEAAAFIGDTEILYAWKFPAPLFRQAPRLRWIQIMGAGVERFLVPELPPDVTVTRVAGVFGSWMAEYTIGWCLWVTQHVALFREQQREHRWAPVDPLRLRGATLCVVGLGDIGREIARTARTLGIRVVGVTRSGRAMAGVNRTFRPRAIRTALGLADFVVLTVPLSGETRGLIAGPELAAMKPSAWLINIARGPVVDEYALLKALRERTIGGAVLDVFDEEPLPPDHPFWDLENVAVTPHIAGPSAPTEIAPIFNDNLRRYVSRRPLRFVVDRRRGY
ncbi:MAG TPA: D-2-hydroxyacid dehydrogenase [Candidatus Methylomirabilis sp.]|nr:D-2-hydroxyacid dehydrogenase [Candidatus Methylomirabilis sp.]